MTPLVVSFYTNELYSRLASRLARSCAEYGFEVEICERHDLGSWVVNCGQKPTHILTMLELHNRDLLWVDADAEFVSEAVGLDLDCDLGFFLARNNRYMSGTLLVRNTKPMRAMLEEWIGFQAEYLEVPDEDGMREIIQRSGGLKTAQLDPGYLYVFDVWKKLYPSCKPIIMHKQASRLYLNPRATRRFRPTRGIRKAREASVFPNHIVPAAIPSQVPPGPCGRVLACMTLVGMNQAEKSVVSSSSRSHGRRNRPSMSTQRIGCLNCPRQDRMNFALSPQFSRQLPVLFKGTAIYCWPTSSQHFSNSGASAEYSGVK